LGKRVAPWRQRSTDEKKYTVHPIKGTGKRKGPLKGGDCFKQEEKGKPRDRRKRSGNILRGERYVIPKGGEEPERGNVLGRGIGFVQPKEIEQNQGQRVIKETHGGKPNLGMRDFLKKLSIASMSWILKGGENRGWKQGGGVS